MEFLLLSQKTFITSVRIKPNKYFRQVDSYRHKGSQKINNIYTFDIEPKSIGPNDESIEFTNAAEYHKNKVNKRMQNLIHAKDPNYKMTFRFHEDPILHDLIKHTPKKIIAHFKKMFAFYIKGEWKQAKVGLNQIIKRKNGKFSF